MKYDIQNREDVALLVSYFYKKLRKDPVLGPFFNETITDWNQHLDRLTTFWETSLFMSKKLEHKFLGNPLEVHVEVDKKFKQSITEFHFGIWLNLW
jgi:hemoglobin